ncbi:MAG: hypothetical protein A2091_09935 [Desulfuromonadales bacterium GWD2_61_12]|nr:MAG: hypothetical protein A2091_09935 [Desulfuromonadales bacterium GWD2_61_12]OGR34077.1 MAG: hypothetical protein A2005_02405 [Desulfuromonadales bacterium GWC2_61_20]
MSAKTTIIAGALLLQLLLCTESQSLAGDNDEQRWQRDPFRYGVHVSASPSQGLARQSQTPADVVVRGLSGIIVSNGVYRALYDGRLVGLGDRVGGAMIREITLYAVVVEDRAGRRRIEIFHDK